MVAELAEVSVGPRTIATMSAGSFDTLSSTSNESSGSSVSSAEKPKGLQQDLLLTKVLGMNENLRLPLGFCLGVNDHVLITDTDNHRVVVIDIITGCLEFSFGGYGTNNGQFVQPRKV